MAQPLTMQKAANATALSKSFVTTQV